KVTMRKRRSVSYWMSFSQKRCPTMPWPMTTMVCLSNPDWAIIGLSVFSSSVPLRRREVGDFGSPHVHRAVLVGRLAGIRIKMCQRELVGGLVVHGKETLSSLHGGRDERLGDEAP